jgi:hypothetical protein
MKIELPEKLLEQLEPGEKVFDALKTTTIASRPDYTVLTNLRIVYFNDKHLGRFELIIIPYSKLQTMRAERGLLAFGKILFIDENNEEISLNRVSKEQIEPFIESLEKALNNIAVEPISIKRIKRLGSNMEWFFEKPAELLFRSQSEVLASSQKQVPDHLEELKMRYVRGEITETEYQRMKKFLESEI